MNNLPVEVLRLIFLSLVQNDQLECMTVCQQWHDIIYHHCLFRVIRVYHKDYLTNLLERVKRDPISGTKVEILELKMDFDSTFPIKDLLQNFPKVRQFTLMKSGYSHSNMVFGEELPNYPWCRSIEKIVEYKSDACLMKVLRFGLCRNLTYIAVEGAYRSLVKEFIRKLENAPALKKLHLRYYSVSLKDLEVLHQMLPSLTTLSLEAITIHADLFPLSIEPATSVAELYCDVFGYGPIESSNQFLRYSSQKYNQLEKLTLQTISFDRSNEQVIQAVAEQELIIRSHLKTLGHRLESLSIVDTSIRGNFATKFDLNALDECCCQIKRLAFFSEFDSSLLEQLANTTQVSYIQSLGIERLGYDSKGGVSLEWIRHFTMLKHLKLAFQLDPYRKKMYQANLTHLLDLLRVTELETLELWQVILDFDNSIKNNDYTSLKRLTLGLTVLKQGVDIVLSQVFTNLKYLKLNDCTFHGKTLSLRDSALSYLKIIVPYSAHNFYVLVTTLYNDHQRLYTAIGRISRYFNPIPLGRADTSFGREDYSSVYTTLPSKPYNKLTDTPMLSIVCKSLWSFQMENK